MNRRTFSKLAATGVMGMNAPAIAVASALQGTRSEGINQPTQWPGQVYRRLLVDTHVPDWNPAFLSRFDAEDYVRTIAKAGFQCLMQYAISAVGLCLWRTKIGQMHRGMKERDYFREVIEQCKRHKLHTVAYFHVVWDNYGFEKHPDWRFQPAEGIGNILEKAGRIGYTCINSPAREFYLALVHELVSNYEFEGMFNDMIAWKGVCYCHHCTARYWKEYGTEPPRIVDWDDPEWRRFQAARQRWLFEFADAFTKTVKSVRSITVGHQFSTVFSNWANGVPLEMGTQTCDFASGDFVGGAAGFSVACKAFDGLSRIRPFEFMTPRNTPNLSDHVTVKTPDELRVESLVPTIHSGAMLTIDAINPDGTINHDVYEYLRKFNEERAPYEPFLGGSLVGDVAVYYDKESMYDPAEKGVPVAQAKGWGGKVPHFDAVLGAARMLREAHIPYGLVTNATLKQLRNYRAVIVPNVLEMTMEQATVFRNFVQEGGVLYASGTSSLDRLNKSGARFLLEEVLGVRFRGKLGTRVTYLSAKDEGMKKQIWPQREVIFQGPMVQVEALPGAEVLATVTLPYVDPEDTHAIGTHYAVLQSDPPDSVPGTDPGLVIHGFGRGKAAWAAAPIESASSAVNARLLVWLLKRVLSGPYRFEVETHPAVEMTLYHQPENRRLLAGLLNMQRDLPPVPVGAMVRVQVPAGCRATAVLRVPDRKALAFEKAGPYVQFRLEPFPVIAMALVEYQ